MQAKPFMRQVASLASLIVSASSLLLGMGILFGLTLLIWVSQFVATFGSSLPVVSGLMLAVVISIELAWSRPKPGESTGLFVPTAVSWLILAVWIAFFPWLLSWETFVVSTFSIASLSSILTQTTITFIAALLTMFLPLFVMTRLICQTCEQQLHHPSVSFLLGGMAIGLLIGSVGFAPWWGLQNLGYAISVVGILLTIVQLVQPAFLSKLFSEFTSTVSQQNVLTTDIIPQTSERTIAVLFLGMMFTIVVRIVSQLFVVTTLVTIFYWSAMLCGGAVASFLSVRFFSRSNRKQPSASTLILFAAVWSVVILFLFPQLTYLMLQTKTYVSPVWLIQLIHLSVLSFILIPLGSVWGCLSTKLISVNQHSREPEEISKKISIIFTPNLLALMTGYLIASWGIVSTRNAAGWLIAITLVTLFFPCWHVGSQWVKKESQAFQKGQLALLSLFVCPIISGPFVVTRYQPERTSQLLFGANIFLSVRQDVDFERLTYLDEGRFVDQIEGEHGTYTLWQHRGGQLHFRENGVPVASVSTNRQFCPASSTDVMQVLLPWVLHDNPQSVLLLGLHGGTSVQTSLSLPVKKVVCIEPDRALQQIVKRNLWSQSNTNPLRDERFSLYSVNSSLAACAQREKHDLIISTPKHTSLLQSSSSLTTEFYQHAALQLTEDGIFCQRFSQADYGPDPLLSLMKSMQTVFAEIMIIETGAAELLLIGTNSQKKLSSPHLVERLQNPYVRKALSQIGWDWSFPVNLRAFNDAAIVNLLNKKESRSNSVANNQLAFQLSTELLRWSNDVSKYAEFDQFVAKDAGKLLNWSVKESEERDVLDRLEDVAGGHKLMANYPDQWWVYRAQVKKQIQQNPRPTIQLVKGEGVKREMHTVLKRRLKFFTTLGNAKKKQHPTIDDLDEIAQFQEPYDPLLSYFLHHEIIKFMPRVVGVDPEIELSYRFHTIYHGHRADRSILNVVDCIHFLVQHPDLFDQRTKQIELDGLLQVLKSRWSLRGRLQPLETKVLLFDITKTLEAIEIAFAEIDRIEMELYQAQTTTQQEQTLGQKLQTFCDGGDPVVRHNHKRNWRHRKAEINHRLTRPLRSYRSQLLPGHQREQLNKMQPAKKEEQPQE